jgi:hypothetical protein
MKYWQPIADLSKAGWSWGCLSTHQFQRRTILVADATSRRRKAFRCASTRKDNDLSRTRVAAFCFTRFTHFEIAGVLVHFDQVARRIVNANHSVA